MNQQGVFRNFLVTVLLLFTALGCSKRQSVFNDPHFYYDKENYTLIRVDPETRDEDIKKYYKGFEKENDTLTAVQVDSFPFDTPPKPIEVIKPVYPQTAQKSGYEGQIEMKLLVDPMGIVARARLSNAPYNRDLKDIEKLFVESAFQAAMHTKFAPSIQGGKPTKCWVNYKIHFKLD